MSNTELLEKFYGHMNTRNIEAMLDLLADDHVDHSLPPGVPTDNEGFKVMTSGYFEVFGELKTTAVKLIEHDDIVASHARVTGKNTGPFMGAPATGKSIGVSMTEMLRFKDGKIVERWGNFAEMQPMQQLGLIPTPGQ